MSSLNIELPGDKLEKQEYINNILAKIRKLCNWNKPSFPGSQPVSLTSLNLNAFQQHSYLACEKTDGIRYLCYAVSERLFLIDRKEIDDPSKPHQNTLLDGELVQDEYTNDDGSKFYKVRYLIYDVITINGEDVSSDNLLVRLSKVYKEVIEPYVKYYKDNPLVDFKAEIISDSQKLWNNPTDSKPAAVRLFVARFGVAVFNDDWLSISGDLIHEVLYSYCIEGKSEHNYAIWECYYNPAVETVKPKLVLHGDKEMYDFNNVEITKGGWVLERIRTDRVIPNDERIAANILKSIEDGLDFDKLEKAILDMNVKRASEFCILPPHQQNTSKPETS